MYILKRLKSRIERLEMALKEARRNLYPGNEDGFLTALGVNEKDFEKQGGGYDFIAALTATAAEDWKEGNEEAQ